MQIIEVNIIIIAKIMILYKCKNTSCQYIYIYRNWIKVTSSVTLRNVILPNNLLQNSYFRNLTVELHILYVLNIHANFLVNWMLFTV